MRQHAWSMEEREMLDETQSLTLTKADLARVLKVSVRSVERLRRAGLLPPTVPGLKRPRFAVASIVKWLDESTQKVGQ